MFRPVRCTSRASSCSQKGGRAFKIFVVHDLGFATSRQTQARRYLLALSAIAVIVFGLLLVLVAWSVVKRWAALLIGDIRSRRFLDDAHSSGLSLPVLSQVRQAMREIEQSQRLEIEYQENWTAQALHQVVREHLKAPQMIVVSNRQPYIHTADGDGQLARADSGERHGHCSRAHHARLLRHLDRAWQRQRRSAGRGYP